MAHLPERTRDPIRVLCADATRCGDFEPDTLMHTLMDAILAKRRLIEAADADQGIELKVKGRGRDAQVLVIATIVDIA